MHNLKDKFYTIFPAFQVKNYSHYFIGGLISLIGTWLQLVALGWLVVELTNSVFILGVIVALDTFPSLIFSLHAGYFVDKFQKRKIIIITQVSMMILAFIVGILTIFHLINIWEIGILAFLSGTVFAFDSPARHAFVVEMVGKEKLASAIALNSGSYNAARVIGPAIAGFLIAIVGVGGAFILNGLSFILVIFVLLSMKVYSNPTKNINPAKAIKEGVHYSATHPIIRSILLYTGIVALFGWSYVTVLPYISKTVYHLGPAGLGYLYAASGFGALTAIVFISARSKKIPKMNLIFGGTLTFVIALIIFSFNLSFNIALISLYFVGFGLIIMFTTINFTIQSMVSDHIRGRVMSIYLLIFTGSTSVGSFLIGFVSEKFGTSFALESGAVIIFISGLTLFLKRHKINTQYNSYHGRQ